MNPLAQAYLEALRRPATDKLAQLILQAGEPPGYARAVAMARCADLIGQGMTKSRAFYAVSLETPAAESTIRRWYYEESPAPPRRYRPRFTRHSHKTPNNGKGSFWLERKN